MAAYIYLLIDPRSGQPRYIGLSQKPCARFVGHLKEAGRGGVTRKCRWIQSLAALGLRPGMLYLEFCTGDGCDQERHWIRHGREQGWNLTNLTDGGDVGMRPDPDVIERLRAKALVRGAKLTPEQREARRDVARRVFGGRKHTPEQIAKRAAARRGQKFSEESRRKLSLAKKGKAPPLEVCEKAWAASRGRTNTPEHRQRISDAQTGRKKSSEELEKITAASKAYWATPEAREAARERGRSRFADPARRAEESTRQRKLTDAEAAAMVAMYAAGASTREIRDRFACSQQSLYRTLRRCDAPLRNTVTKTAG